MAKPQPGAVVELETKVNTLLIRCVLALNKVKSSCRHILYCKRWRLPDAFSTVARSNLFLVEFTHALFFTCLNHIDNLWKIFKLSFFLFSFETLIKAYANKFFFTRVIQPWLSIILLSNWAMTSAKPQSGRFYFLKISLNMYNSQR